MNSVSSIIRSMPYFPRSPYSQRTSRFNDESIPKDAKKNIKSTIETEQKTGDLSKEKAEEMKENLGVEGEE